MLEQYAYHNGHYLPINDLHVGIHTSTLHYGLGLFEGIRCYPTEKGPAVFRLHEHVARLCHGARALDLQLPYSAEEISQSIVQLLHKNGLEDAYVRPLVYLGGESLKVNPQGLSVNLSITTLDFSNYHSGDLKEKGMRLKISSFTRQNPAAGLVHVKCNGSYVNSQLAIKESLNCGFDDALMLDAQGMLAEASGANLFIVRGGKLLTPDSRNILPGITRASIMELAASLGLAVEEAALPRDQAYMADEIFLTGTAYEVVPVVKVDHVTIGQGRPGPISMQLSELYQDQVHGRELLKPHWLTMVRQ